MSIAWAADEWPPDSQIEQLVEAGVRVIEVEGAVILGGETPGRTVRFIRFLRDATSRLVVVRWAGGVELAPDDLKLSHLGPPENLPAQPHLLDQWRSGHRYAAFYWRQGPGFVLVKDTRPGRPVARYLIEGQLDMQAFHALHGARRRSTVPSELRDSVDALVAAGLAVQAGDWITLLPTRIRLWPVPFTAI